MKHKTVILIKNSEKIAIVFLAIIFSVFFASLAVAQFSCSADSECNDQNPDTVDICRRSGQDDSGCSNLSCIVPCVSDGDCDDSNDLTLDVCSGAGRCNAVCSYLEFCGNGVVDPGETSCNCPQDVGSCDGSASGACREFACIGEVCQQTIILGCCGNNVCEFKENFSNCSSDCKVKDLTIEIEGIQSEEYFIRGEEVSFRAIISADFIEISDAEVKADGFFGVIKLFNDGRHNDGSPFDNIYGGTFFVPETIEADTYSVTINALFENTQGIKTFDFVVEPKLEIRLDSLSEEFFLGDSIDVSGIISKKTKGIKSIVTMTVYSNNIQVAQETVESNDLGEFSYSYRTSFLENEGDWTIEAFSRDELENTGFVEKSVLVSSSEITAFLNVNLVKELKRSYSRGEDIEISFSLTDNIGTVVSGAQVSLLLPDSAPLILEEADGTYFGVLEITHDFPLGEQEIKVNALKSDSNNFFAGSTLLEFFVETTEISIQITQPDKKSVQVGEEIEFKLIVTYPNKKPVILSQIDSNVNGKKIILNAVDKGVYTANYIVSETDAPILFFEVLVDDSFGNKADENLEIEVSGISIFYYLREFGLQWFVLIITIIFMSVVLFLLLAKKGKLSNLKKEEQKILGELKNTQSEYFKDGTLDRKNYERLMEKKELKLEDVRKSIEQFNNKK